MWAANLFYATIGCSWLMAGLAISRPSWAHGALAHASYRRAVVAYGCWCSLFLPPVYRALDRATAIPNGTRLVLAATAIIGAYLARPWLHWLVPPQDSISQAAGKQSGQRALSLLCSGPFVCAVLVGAIVSFVLAGKTAGVRSEPLNGTFLAAYGRDGGLLAFLVLAHGYIAAVFLSILVAYRPVLRGLLHRFPDPLARCRFQCSVYTAALGLLYNLHEGVRSLLHFSRVASEPTGHNATASLLLALFNVTALLCYSVSPRWLAYYLAYRQLAPLWWTLYRAIPTIAHRPPWSRPTDGLWLGPQAVNDRLRSRVYEIWDGISTLYPYRSATLAQHARAACAVAALPDEQIAAIVEAVLLKDSIAALGVQQAPVANREPLPGFAQESFGEQIAFLQRVVWAYARSPLIPSVLATIAPELPDHDAGQRHDPRSVA